VSSCPFRKKKKKEKNPYLQARSFHADTLLVLFEGNLALGVREGTVGAGDNEGPCSDTEGIKGGRISGFPPKSCMFQWNPKL
jgi:hypothetical protein